MNKNEMKDRNHFLFWPEGNPLGYNNNEHTTIPLLIDIKVNEISQIIMITILNLLRGQINERTFYHS